MAGNHLEQLVAEWYEWRGYFVRRNVRVGKREKGGHECELDVVAFHPAQQKLVQIEPSLDAEDWATRERRYTKKFEAGKRYIPELFHGCSLPQELLQIAMFTNGANRTALAGGKVLLAKDFLREILTELRGRRIESQAVPEEFPLLRTLQFAAQYWPLNPVRS